MARERGPHRVLLFRHTYRPFAPWGLPSGVLKPDESLEDSMKREVREEAGLAIEFDAMLRTRASSRPRRVDVWMKYHSLGGTPSARSAEIDAAEFFELDALPELIVEQRRFLEDHRSSILGNTVSAALIPPAVVTPERH